MNDPAAPIPNDASLAEVAALYRVTSAIIDHTDLIELLQIVADSVADALPAERIAIITFDLAARKVLHFVKGGTGLDSVRTVPFDELLGGLSGWVLQTSEPALSLSAIPDPRESPEVQKRRADTNCGDIIVVPLRYQGKTLGTMTAINRPEGAPFGQREVDLMMAMATHSAVAITSAESQSRLRVEIEERKNLEASLALARDQALEASRLKSEFMANMSHEVRTPMNAILGMLHLLQSTELTTRQRDYASKSEGAARSLLRLLNDILDFSKAEAGKMTVEREPFQMDRLLRNLSVVLSANVGTKAIEVLFDIEHALPDLLLGDAMRLQQVLVNLGGNAIKFTSEGQVVIRLRAVAKTAASATIEFSISDTGIGITQEAQTRIFSGFSQAEASTTRLFGGTGLGLAISKHFVELMGGQIHLDSAPNRGSTFSFALEFPLQADNAGEPAAPHRPALALQHVLVVDDNAIARELTAHMVQSWGWPVEQASDGEQAMAQINAQHALRPGEFPFPLILMDWKMPGVDGWETAQRIRQFADQHQLTQPTIIMVTASGRDTLGTRSEAEQSTLNGFVVKPVTPSMLLEAILESREGNPGVRKAARRRSSLRQLAGMRVLVVEDNLINQQVAEELLRAEGAIVSIAANGQLGVEAVAAAKPQFDVVLMDIQMPVLDGYGATRAIRETLGLRRLPIIAMTANAMASDREACLAAGMNEHIGKPFEMSALISLLIRATGIGSASPAAQADEPVTASADALQDEPVRVPGLDLQVALARMSGMRALYVRTAREFVTVLDSVVPELQKHVQEQDKPAAVMRLHTLKGNAGTLGAKDLAAQAAVLELACKSQEGWEQCAAGLEALAAVCRSTQALLNQAIALLSPAAPDDAQAAAAPISAAKALPALRELDALALASDMQVLGRFAQLRDHIEGLPNGFYAKLEDALNKLDVTAAHDLCADMIGQLASDDTGPGA